MWGANPQQTLVNLDWAQLVTATRTRYTYRVKPNRYSRVAGWSLPDYRLFDSPTVANVVPSWMLMCANYVNGVNREPIDTLDLCGLGRGRYFSQRGAQDICTSAASMTDYYWCHSSTASTWHSLASSDSTTKVIESSNSVAWPVP